MFGRIIFWATDDWATSQDGTETANQTVGRHLADGWAKCVKEEKLKTSDTIKRQMCAGMSRDENQEYNIDKYDQSISAGSLQCVLQTR